MFIDYSFFSLFLLLLNVVEVVKTALIIRDGTISLIMKRQSAVVVIRWAFLSAFCSHSKAKQRGK